jgi:hypothetical protein
VAELFQHREQPVETGVAFDGDVQPPRLAGPQGAEFLFQRVDLGQDAFGQPQHAQARRRQAHGFGAADEKLDPGLILQPLDLMRQRRLRHVQHIGRAGEAAGLMDGADGAQVAEFEMHVYAVVLMLMMSIMNLSHIAISATRGVRIRSAPCPTPRISFEFFPPQTLDASFRLWETVQMLAPLRPVLRVGDLWRGRHHPQADA